MLMLLQRRAAPSGANVDFNDLHGIELTDTRRELSRHICENSLYEFLRRAWQWVDPSPFADGWPYKPACEQELGVPRRGLKVLK